MNHTRREFLAGGAAFLTQAAFSPSLSWAKLPQSAKVASLLWDPTHHLHDLAGHPESSPRVSLTKEFLLRQGLWRQGQVRELTKISEDILKLGHKPSYIQYVRDSMKARAPGLLEPDKWSAYFGPHTFEVAARAATGLAHFCADVATGRARRGFALIRPPGHHATAGRSEGFCIFNNVALSALHVLAESKGTRRIAIVDVDAHHGNGIQELTQGNAKIVYISTHQRNWFPYQGHLNETGVGEGKGNVMNLPLPVHTGDQGYELLMKTLILPKLAQFQPDFLIVCAGYDAHWADYLAELGLSLKGMQSLHRSLIEFADTTCGGKVVFALEGGYNLQALSRGVANTVALLQGHDHFYDILGASPYPEPSLDELIEQAKKIHKL